MKMDTLTRRNPPPTKPRIRAAKKSGTTTAAVAPPAPAAPPIGEELARYPSLQLDHPLEQIFKDALAQATRGKGDARHGQGRDSRDPANFMAQDWYAIARRHGAGFLTGQAEKKLRESLDLSRAERRTEKLGVLVYVAMSIILDDKVG